MRKLAWVLSLMMVMGLVMASTGMAGEMADVAEKAAAVAEEAATSTDAAETVDLAGTILKSNTFVDESGESYELAESEANKVCQSLVGEKIKIKATVMEKEEGLKSIIVSSYEIIE